MNHDAYSSSINWSIWHYITGADYSTTIGIVMLTCWNFRPFSGCSYLIFSLLPIFYFESLIFRPLLQSFAMLQNFRGKIFSSFISLRWFGIDLFYNLLYIRYKVASTWFSKNYWIRIFNSILNHIEKGNSIRLIENNSCEFSITLNFFYIRFKLTLFEL